MTTAVLPARRSHATGLAYLGSAIVLAALNAVASGLPLISAGGLGATAGTITAGAILAGVVKLFRRSTNVPRWIFWWAVVAFVLAALRPHP